MYRSITGLAYRTVVLSRSNITVDHKCMEMVFFVAIVVHYSHNDTWAI